MYASAAPVNSLVRPAAPPSLRRDTRLSHWDADFAFRRARAIGTDLMRLPIYRLNHYDWN